MEARDFRPIMLFHFKLGIGANECQEQLEKAFPGSAPVLSTISRWYFRFGTGDENLDDKPRIGRSISVLTAANVALVQKLVEADPRITYDMIEEETGLKAPTIYRILHDHLNMSKVCARWVPHFLSDDQKKARVKFCQDMIAQFDGGESADLFRIVTGDETWVYCYEPLRKQQDMQWVVKGDPRPVKIQKQRSVGKVMVAAFFSLGGLVHIVRLEKGSTVNAHWYSNVCLKEVFQKITDNHHSRLRVSNLFLHHDNASAHTAALTKEYLGKKKVTVLNHPPYSPDLAPCDFYLFPKIKDLLRGKRYEDEDEAFSQFLYEINQLTPNDWEKCMKSWFGRMRECIEWEGEYFEKQ